MKSKKQNVMIVRLDSEEKQMIEKLRKKNSINMSSLVRNFIIEYYEKHA